MTIDQKNSKETSTWKRVARRGLGALAAAAVAVPLFAGCAATAEGNNGKAPSHDPKSTSEVTPSASPSPKETESAKPDWKQMNLDIMTRSEPTGEIRALQDMSIDEYRYHTTVNQRLNYLDHLANRELFTKMINQVDPNHISYNERVTLSADSTPEQLFDDYYDSALLLLTLTTAPEASTDNTCGPIDSDGVNKAVSSYTYDTTFHDLEVNTALNLSSDSGFKPDQAICPTGLVGFSHVYADSGVHISKTEKTSAKIENKDYPAYILAYTLDKLPDSKTVITLANVDYQKPDGSTGYRAIETNRNQISIVK